MTDQPDDFSLNTIKKTRRRERSFTLHVVVPPYRKDLGLAQRKAVNCGVRKSDSQDEKLVGM